MQDERLKSVVKEKLSAYKEQKLESRKMKKIGFKKNVTMEQSDDEDEIVPQVLAQEEMMED